MKIIESYGDICEDVFTEIAIGVSGDLTLGAGVAKAIDEKYNIKKKLMQSQIHGNNWLVHVQEVKSKGKTIHVLVDKPTRYDKLTYKDLETCLTMLKNNLVTEKKKSIAMPRIGCGRDHLEWDKVKEIIERVFKDTDIEILVLDYSE